MAVDYIPPSLPDNVRIRRPPRRSSEWYFAPPLSSFVTASVFRIVGQAAVAFVPNFAASTGVFTITGSAAVSFVGESVATVIAVGGYTYEATAAPAAYPIVLHVRRDPAPSISRQLGTTIPTATFRVDASVTPVNGQDVQLDFSDGLGVQFAGVIQNVSATYEGGPLLGVYDITVVDYIWILAGRCPYGCWTEVSATTVVQALVSTFAPGFTSTNVEAALDPVTVAFDGTKTFIECLNEIAQQVGQCYFYVDFDKDLHFFTTDVTDLPDDLTNSSTTLQKDEPLVYELDDSQIRNQVTVLGVSTTVAADAPVGASVIEIDSGVYFSNQGTVASGCQRFSSFGTFTTSVSPARPTAPSASGVDANGNGLSFTARQAYDPLPPYLDLAGKIHVAVRYAVSVVDAAGNESELSQDAVGPDGLWTADVGSLIGVTGTTGGSVPQGVLLRYKVSSYDDAGGIGILMAPNDTFTTITLGGSSNAVNVSLGVEWNPMVAGRHIWREDANSGTFYHVGSFGGRAAGTFTDTKASADLLQARPLDAFGTQYFFNSTGKQVDVDIPVSAAGTTRKLFRRVGGQSSDPDTFGPYRLLATLDATTTRYRDNKETPRPDQVEYNVSVGLTPDGESASTGGDSPSDFPAITRTYLRVSGLTEPLPKGSKIQLFYQANDTDSQADYAARYGGDGVREQPAISDESLVNYAALARRAAAELAAFKNPIETLRYMTRDTKTKPGKPIVVSLTHPSVSTTLMIQSVTPTLIGPGHPPTYSVMASSVKYTWQDFMHHALTG